MPPSETIITTLKPLSPQRHAIMLVVMMALFGGSLAFAQMLVNARRPPMPQVVTIIRPPGGFSDPVKGYEMLPGAILTGSGQVEGRPRMYVAISREADARWTSETAQAEAMYLYEQVLNHPVENRVVITNAILGRMAAYDIAGEFGDRDDRHFLLQRMAVLPGRVVAICFSGSGRLTDADRELFNEFCTFGVNIRMTTPRTITTRPQ